MLSWFRFHELGGAMKRTFLFAFLMFIEGVCNTYAWGFFAHREINKLAVFCLPPEMYGFYRSNIDYLWEHAVDPDKRRYLVKGEGEKHFIDLDRYESALPLDTVPFTYGKALEKYGKDTLHANGIGPWNILWMMDKLTEAFRTKDTGKILKYSAELGHYVADAHVPLHTTSNYNGQQTNQHGIHAFFESRLPELFYPGYDFFVGQASYLHHPLEHIWKAVSEGYALLPNVFEQERLLQIKFPEDQKYQWETRGQQQVRAYSRAFSEAYHKALLPAVEERMQASVKMVACCWYTAWVNAGQPVLDGVKALPPTPELLPELQLQTGEFRPEE